jgi:rod shape determining protein RodA
LDSPAPVGAGIALKSEMHAPAASLPSDFTFDYNSRTRSNRELTVSGTHWTTRTPWLMAASVLGLMLLGLSGIERGDQLAGGDFASRQMVWIGLAVPTIGIVGTSSYRGLKHFAYALFGVGLLLLIVVFFMPAYNGSRRWIPLGVMKFQPSEMVKLAYILALARYLIYRSNYRRLTGLIVPFLLTLVPIGLILKEPDLGTSLVFIPILFAMLFVAGARLRHLAMVSLVGGLCLPMLWVGMSAEQKSRVVTLFTQTEGGGRPTGDGYHLYQSKQVISLGGILGSQFEGVALDDPLAYHLPAGQTDFVFSLISERWGIAGSGAVLLCYLILISQGLRVAHRTREPFGRLICVGVTAMIASQAMINTGMTVGLMPITGLTLPLVSYGGSSLLATSIAIGLMINVALRPGYEIGTEPFRFGPDSTLAGTW